jgi:hypothetical protein
MTYEASCLDYFSLTRPDEDFDVKDNPAAALTDEQLSVVLMMQIRSIENANALNMIIVILWIVCAHAPGFAVYDGLAGTESALAHSGFWLALEAVCLYFVIRCPDFKASFVLADGRTEKSVAKTYEWNLYGAIALGISTVFCIIHAVLTGLETRSCSSTLCTQSNWLLWSFFTLLIVLALLHVWQLMRIMVYRKTLYQSMIFNRMPDMSLSNKTYREAPSSKGGSARTPLLRSNKK